ncbi:hypothetical protein D7V77_04910 [Corallococcus sp. CA041A]|uniref:hypothetical protein n=1 Tax=Corallococcus sp. CA041A TaxID=2316727 RepID=UPI000EA2E65B|nr:hypothetical protein [Corallococcus sp. CA041A]RKH29774.1 hypothetical protein D7V77_04910 [Corallococcus sp. CA041A]
MDPLSQYQTRRVWIELPSRWIRVVARFARPRSLDRLESAVLQLVGLRERTEAELAEILGDVSVDMVASALRGLQAMGRVHEQGGPISRWLAPPEANDGLDDPQVGWVALSPHREDVIPELVLGDVARVPQRQAGGHPELSLEEHVRPELPERLPELIRRAVRMGMSAVVTSSHREGGAVTNSEREPRVTALRMDWDAKSGKSAPVERVKTCWALLEVVPGLTGRATLVFHEPQWVPTLESERPVSSQLETWIRQSLPGTWQRIEVLQRELRVDHSIVLQLAKLKDMAALEALIERHRAGWREKLPHTGDFFQGWGEPELAESLRDAHRWFLLWKQNPTFMRQSVDAFGHAIERLARFLADQSLPALKRWAQRWRASKEESRAEQQEKWSSKSAYVGALSHVGLVDALRPSQPYLLSALKNLKALPEVLGRPQGAGGSISLWLLPLFLGESSERNALAALLGRSITLEPTALTVLDELRQLRNDAAHSKHQIDMRPDRADEFLARLLWALGAGLDG